MISRLKGTLVSREIDKVEIDTSGGVVYEVQVPLSVYERLPPEGAGLELRTLQVVREDSVTLCGFTESHERELFKRLLTASGVGPKLALAMLSTFNAHRLAQALAQEEINALTQISGVGRKKAEKLCLELSDKVQDLAVVGAERPGAPPHAEQAVAALIHLGFTFAEADEAVRGALNESDSSSAEELIKSALARA